MSHVRKTDTRMSTITLAAISCKGHDCPARSATPARQRRRASGDEKCHAEPAIAPPEYVARAEELRRAARRCDHDEGENDEKLYAERGEGLRDEWEETQSHRDDVAKKDRPGIVTQVCVVLVTEHPQVNGDGDEEEADERTRHRCRGHEEVTPFG